MANGAIAFRDGQLVVEPAGAHSWSVSFPPPIGRVTSLSAPLPEGLTLGRSLGADTARAYFAVGLRGVGAVVPRVARAAGLIAKGASRTPAWPLLHTLVDRLPEGPPEELRQRATALIVAEVRAGDEVRRSCVNVPDFYAATARIAVAFARRLLAGDVKPGALTPAQAAPAEEILREAGTSFAY
jgi:short subunit dehydrogenase-like uncharacterized protein